PIRRAAAGILLHAQGVPIQFGTWRDRLDPDPLEAGIASPGKPPTLRLPRADDAGAPGPTRHIRRNCLADHSLAHGAIGIIERSHTAIELRAVGATVIVKSAFVGAHGGGGERVALGIAFRAILVFGG